MPAKLLFVDDEADVESLMRMKFRRQLRDNQFEMVFAHSGTDALSKLSEHPDICLVLSDINMPEMNGLTLLQRIIELKNPLLKTVVVSAYGDMENIRTAMNRGAFDFVTKPIDFADLETTIRKTLDHVESTRKSLEEHDQLVSVRRDLNIATRIQQSIIPRIFPAFPERKEFDIYARMVTAREVGGDFYDYYFIDDNHLAFVVGDVSGKGVPAAIYMAMSRTLLKGVAHQIANPGECVTRVNDLLVQEHTASMFVTMFYAVLDIAKGELQYCNAGHNSPLLLPRNGPPTYLEAIGGTFVGMIPGIAFETKTISLGSSDSIFVYTDGVTEAANDGGEMYGEDRLMESLKKTDRSSLQNLLDSSLSDVQGFSGKAPQADDITMLVLQFTG